MSFFYYAGDAAHDAQALPLPRTGAARFGQGPSRRRLSVMTARLASFAVQAIHGFDRCLHAAIEALAASKLRRIERELQLRGVRYGNHKNRTPYPRR